MVCGKKEVIDTKNNTWHYFSKMDINSQLTTKWYYVLPKNLSHSKDISILSKLVRVPNDHYDKNAKRKYIEMWECDKCYNE